MNIEQRVQKVFRTTFNNDAIVTSRDMDASSIAGWDSLAHVNLILAVEEEFNVRFRLTEIGRMRNVGDLIDFIVSKIN